MIYLPKNPPTQKNQIIFIPYDYNICKNLLNLNIHSLFFTFEFKAHMRKIAGNIIIINGKHKDIEKLINAFLKIKICVF